MTKLIKFYTRIYDANKGQFITSSVDITANFKLAVQTKADLPTSSNSLYDARITLDDNHLYIYTGPTWVDQGASDVYDYVVEESIPGPIDYISTILGLSDSIKNLALNIMLNAFRIAIQGSLTLLQMVDSFVDEYQDENNINLGASINQSYDSDNFYRPTDSDVNKLLLHNEDDSPFIDSSVSAHTITNSGASAEIPHKFGNKSAFFDAGSVLIPAYSIPDSTDWDLALNNTDSRTWELFVRIDGQHYTAVKEAPLFHQTQDGSNFMKLRNNSSSTPDNKLRFEIVSGGVTKVLLEGPSINESSGNELWHHIAIIKNANEYGLYLDGTQIAYTTNDDSVSLNGDLVFGSQGYNTLIAYIDEVRFVNANPYNASPDAGLFDIITVPTTSLSNLVNNMTLVSDPQTADSVPTEARLVIFEEDVDSATLNTDIKGYISRDGGTTFTQVTLIEEAHYDNPSRIISGSVSVASQPSGTSMVYKITTHNTKHMKIHGTGILWN